MYALRGSCRGWIAPLITFFLVFLAGRTAAQSNARFSAFPLSGCAPLVVQFTDASAGNPLEWHWNLGNGVNSVLQHPSTTYSSPGTYPVKLVVRTADGKDSVVKNSYITVYPNPEVRFLASDSSGCVPFPIQFTDRSTTPTGTITSWNWDFGDGSIGSGANPLHRYESPGTFTVTLKTTNSFGCFKAFSKVQYVNAGQRASAQFTSLVPDPCKSPGTVQFTAAATEADGADYTWHFGDGTTGEGKEVTKKFTGGKTYNVKLVTELEGCADSSTRGIAVSTAAVTNFSAPETESCTAPFTVSFVNETTGARSYKWHFGDGGTSSAANPKYTYKTGGSYTVTLISFYGNGCSDTLVRPDFIHVQKPGISLSGLGLTGCTPLTVSPAAMVAGGEGITTYLWNFGDGATSTDPEPTHIYTTTGNYTVSLQATTTGGCTGTVAVANAVRVGTKPNAGFSINPSPECNANPVSFVDQSTGGADEWLWKFGDKDSSTQQNPVHTYEDAGKFPVTLMVWNNTCPDTLTIQGVVDIKPPFASFVLKTSCANKYKKDFVDKSRGATSWHWDFGDGTTSDKQHPSHTYATKGAYKVTLVVSAGGCSNSMTQTVEVIDEKAVFAAEKDIICKGTSVTFSGVDIKASSIAKWQWNFGDGAKASGSGSAGHTFKKTGTFTVSLTITDSLGCVDKGSLPVTVHGPTAEFIPEVSGVCFGRSTATFNDLSSAPAGSTIVKRIWKYGTGTLDSSAGLPKKYTYSKAGQYTVGLTVEDNFGCRNTVSKAKAIVVSQPKAAFSSPDTVGCIGSPVRFSNASDNEYEPKYQWLFGDGTSAAGPDSVHRYAATGTYSVRLAVMDKYGCTDTAFRKDYISIRMPEARFTVSDSIGNCPPLMLHFTNSSAGYSSLKWDFDDGNTSALNDPGHFYTTAGTYFPRLVVTGPGGCTDTAGKRILVKGPKGSFTYGPLTGCTPLTVDFKATASDFTSIVWDYRDGTTLTTLEKSVAHTYTEPGNYPPKMIVTDETGCSVYLPGKDTVKVREVTAAFTADHSLLCGPGTVAFRNGSTAANDIIAAYAWTFGDGGSGTEASPVHRYGATGSYTARLIATTLSGCKDTALIEQPVTVYERPDITLAPPPAACAPATVAFTGTVAKGVAAALQWAWNFGNGQTATQQAPAQRYASAGIYPVTAVVTDDHGCRDTATTTVTVQAAPPTNAGPDAVVCEGSSVTLRASGAETYSWREEQAVSCMTCANPVATPAETTTFVVTGFSSLGCSSTDSVTVRVRRRFSLQAGPADTICAGESAQLWASGADSYTWSPAAGLENARAARTKARPAATTLYTVTAADNDHCFTETATVKVTVGPLPTVEAGPALTVSLGTPVTLKPAASADVTTWRWTPGTFLNCVACPEPVALPKESVTYSVTVKNEFGCAATDAVRVSVVCNSADLFIPNTFSPNGDGKNDRFYPRTSGVVLIRSLRVYNRWGEVVYEKRNFNANDPAAGWDGTFNGKQLPPDTFIYFCESVCANGEVLPYKGDITLIR